MTHNTGMPSNVVSDVIPKKRIQVKDYSNHEKTEHTIVIKNWVGVITLHTHIVAHTTSLHPIL
jgi:hypothetical protein